jgi:hypothetical protein
VSSCVKAASGRITGDAAARLPSRSDQDRAARRAASFSLSKFMAIAVARVRQDWSSSLVTGRGCRRKATFASRGLDATNWRAELAIRFGVVLRKVWGGSRTWVGARAQSVLMSVWRTCWQQGRSALDFLSQLLRGTPVALALPP